MTTIRRQMKNMVKNYSDAEVKVREATSNDPWGPSSTLMSEISDLTYNIVALGEVMRMLWKRLNDHGKNWRHVYKSLVLLDYLIKNGNEKVAQQCKEHIVAIQTLKDFQFMDEQKDQGASVREKAKQLVNLLRDDERLKQERAKAFRARERYAQNAMGISSDNKMTYGTAALGVSGISSRLGASSRTSGNYADPYGGAGGLSPGEAGRLAANLAPDLEAVRPSDANEEDLQIKLAIMLSQQEHEDDVQKKRMDDTKLHIALEESKTEAQPNGLVDLADFQTPTSRNNNNRNNVDPWGNTSTSSNNVLAGTGVESDTDSDDFFPNRPAATSHDPWAINGVSGSSTMNNNKDPWSSGDPWGAQADTNNSKVKADDFDLFSSNRTTTNNNNFGTSTSASQLQPTNKNNNDPFGDFFGGSNTNTTQDPYKINPISSTGASAKMSTNPWNSGLIPPLTTTTNVTIPTPTATAATRKTPESFLGENSSLVNLDNLISTSVSSNNSSSMLNRPKSTNPFGGPTAVPSYTAAFGNPPMSTSNSTGQLSGLGFTSNTGGVAPINNPFLIQQQLNNQKQPTISQLQQQQQYQMSSGPSVGAVSQFGQLAQPLIPPAQQPSSTAQSTNPFLMM